VFDPHEFAPLRRAIRDCTIADRRLLDEIRAEVRMLAPEVRTIKPRSTTSMSIVASDGGNNQLVFDPFQVQLVRVVDSYGKPLCVDAVTPFTDPDALSRRQFNPDGTARTALGQLMADLGTRTLSQLSHMVPPGVKVRERPHEVSPGWVLVYRDLCEWAALYERICHRSFATDTLLVRDGQLRSKLFRGEYFVQLRKRVDDAIVRIRECDRRRVFVVGVAKHTKPLTRYSLAMSLESTLPGGEARYVRLPRELEAKAYIWPEYAWGPETEGEGQVPKFVAGDMFFVRFGTRTADPVWSVDILSSQSTQAAEIFAHLLADAIDGFPIPFYPRCVQKAHESAALIGFDMDILQAEVTSAIRELLSPGERPILDGVALQSDVSGRRYEG